MSEIPWAVPATIWLLATLILWAPHWTGRVSMSTDHVPGITVLLAVTIFAPSGVVAFLAAALAAGLHAWRARPHTRTGAVTLALSGAAAMVAAVALVLEMPVLVFAASGTSIALRVGLIPFHTGVAQLCERLPALQSQQLATTIALVVAHLRFADQVTLAYDLAPMLVRYGAVMTLLPALMALVQKDLRGFYRCATVMHGGMLFAAIGAAGRGHATAALMVVITTAAAMGGMGVMVSALEDRTGPVSLGGPGGRVQAFPRLAAAFALFGGAGVAMPGTAGFIADDLLLHALWEESVPATVTMILGSAVLAVATLQSWSRIFLGKAVPSLAPDLAFRERTVVVGLVLLLVWLGVTPGVLLTPAETFLGGSEHMLVSD